MTDTTTTLTGKVRGVNVRGFAFIEPDSATADSDKSGIFFHRSAMIGNGFDLLQEGDAVSYTVEANPSPKGPRAATVTPA